MNKSHEASIKNLEMLTRQLSHHVASIPDCGGGFFSNIVDNTINESYKAIELSLEHKYGVVKKRSE